MPLNTHAKLASASLCLALALAALPTIVGCANSQTGPGSEYQLPADYASAVTELRTRAEALDGFVVGGRFELARHEAWLLVNLCGHMSNLSPSQGVVNASDQREFMAQANDLRVVMEQVLYRAGLRHGPHAADLMEEFARRYNRFSGVYGPGDQLRLATRAMTAGGK